MALIMAPRKPERFADAAANLRLRTYLDAPHSLDSPGADVLLLDSIGELSALFPYATAVFMGGTLADRGVTTFSNRLFMANR